MWPCDHFSWFQYRTQLIPVVQPVTSGKTPDFVYLVPDEKDPTLSKPVFLELTPAPNVIYKPLPGSSKEMNVLGIVIFSATIGTANYNQERTSQCNEPNWEQSGCFTNRDRWRQPYTVFPIGAAVCRKRAMYSLCSSGANPLQTQFLIDFDCCKGVTIHCV